MQGPMILYKYLKPERALSVLRSKRIRFTQPGDFNDPFEFRPVWGSIFPERLRERAMKEAMENALRRLPAEQIALAPGLLNQEDALKAMDAFIDAETPRMKKGLDAGVGELGRLTGLLCLSEVRFQTPS